MKKHNLKFLILALFLLNASFIAIKAQDEMPAEDAQQNFNRKRRPNLLSELDLSQNQILQIRRINADKKPLLRDAQQRFRESQQKLDQAIYSDELDEAEIQARLKAAQAAQAEIIKIRSSTELAVRKVLNAEQLIKFREIRQKFIDRMQSDAEPRGNRPLNAPNRKLFNRGRRQRQNN